MTEYWSVVSLPSANASASAQAQPFEPGHARKATLVMPAPASVGLPAATETVAPSRMAAPAVGAFRVNTVGAVASRVIVRLCSVFAFRSVTVTWLAPGEVTFAVVQA